MYTFKKADRLRDKKLIDLLFSEGHKMREGGFVAFWLPLGTASGNGLQTMVSVSKKKFRHAAQRNYIRRLMREAIRKNKNPLVAFLESCGMKCSLALIFTADEKPTAAGTEAKIILLLRRLEAEYEKLTG